MDRVNPFAALGCARARLSLAPALAYAARRLEAGAPLAPFSRQLAGAWDAVARDRIARPLELPRGPRVVAIGGATLGGSGKTPLARACAEHLVRSGARVVVVGHAYRATPHAARVVAPDDAVEQVGDEALALARAGLCVVVGPSRQSALDFAATRPCDVVILDGVAQTRPVRASLALLAIDAEAPWGSGRAPPAGDRRAPPDALLAACDLAVAIVDAATEARARAAVPLASESPLAFALVESRGAYLSSDGVACAATPLLWRDVAESRVGLVTALARPDRALRFLAARGVVPRVTVVCRDHCAPSPRDRAEALRADVDLWLASAKCAVHAGCSLGRAPVAVIDYALRLSERAERALTALHGTAPRGSP